MVTSHVPLLLLDSNIDSIEKIRAACAAIETATYHLTWRDCALLQEDPHPAYAAYLVNPDCESLPLWVERAYPAPTIAICETAAAGQAALAAGAVDYWLVAEIDPRMCERSLRLTLAAATRQINEARFHTLAQQTAVGLGHCDRDGRLLWVNPQLAKIVGRDPATLLHASLADLTEAEDWAIEVDYFQALIAGTQNHYCLEKRLRDRDGKPVWVLAVASLARNERGQPWLVTLVVQDISDRLATERELQQSKRLIETIANTSPQLLYLYDVSRSCYTYINHQIEAILGYTAAEVQGYGSAFFRDRLHPEDRQHQADPQTYLAQIEGNEVVELEYRLQHKNGSWRWLRSQEVAFNRDRQGTVSQILGTAQDITAHKSIEMQLWQSEARLHAIVANLSDGILIVDRQGIVRFANPAATVLFNQPQQDLIGCEFGLPLLTRNTTEIDIIRQDGSLGTGEMSVAIAHWDGELVYVVCARDITARRQAETTLRESEERFRQLADHLESVFWLADFRNNELLYVSPAYESIWGRSCESLLAEPSKWIENVVPEDCNLIWQGRQRHQNGEAVTIEYRIIRPDGEIRWISDRSFPIPNPNGAIARAAGIAEDITERKQAELALRHSEERWRALFEQAAVGIFVMTLPERFEQVNQKFCDLTGYTATELLTLPYSTLIPPHRRLEAQRCWQALIDNHVSRYSVEKEYKRQDGSTIWVNLALSLIGGSDERPWYAIGAVTDISDRVATEAALRDSEERLRAIFEQMTVGIAYTDVRGRFLWVNEKFCTLVGYSEAELQQKRDRDLTHPDDYQWEAELASSLANERLSSYSLDKRYRHRSGKTFWVNLSLSVARADSGEIKYTVAIITDIGDRKRAEHALRQQVLRERLLAQISQNIHSSVNLDQILNRTVTDARQLLEADRALIFRLTPDRAGTVSQESVRDGFAPTLGLQFEDEEFPADCYHRYCQGEPRIIADISQDETANCLLEYLQQLGVKSRLCVPILVGESLWGLLIVHQCTHLRHWQPWEVNLLRQIGIQVAIAIQQTELYRQLESELNERRRTQAQLQQAKEVADAANRAKSEFLANMSHELRTPLNAILGFTQLLDRAAKRLPAEDSPLLSQHQEYLEIIGRSGEHLLGLINDILDLSKIEAGRMSLTLERFDLWQLLDRLEEMFRFKAAAKGLELHVQRSPHLPQFIETDAKKLRSTLINLLGNAVKFTETGSIRLRARAENPVQIDRIIQLHFEVEDTGIGINTEELPQIFNAFAQTRARESFNRTLRGSLRDRVTEGTGLGLAISQHFVQLMGGEITVRSQVGVGSCFEFAIPCRCVVAIPATPITAEQYAIGIVGDRAEYRIAIIEDDITNCQLLSSLLDPLGFVTRSAANGQDGLKLWQQWQPHLILMDLRMPIMDGYEATRRIRDLEQQSCQPPVKIIALTASVFHTQQQEPIRFGCDDLIVKPFTESELLAKIAACLQLSYQYALPLLAKPATASASLHPQLTPADLSNMSPEWRSQLRLAALSARSKRLHQLIAQMPSEQAAVAAALSYWVERLDFDRIIELVE